MPVCRSAAYALARSRIAFNASLSKSLTPFLYQTPTIQQFRPISSHTAISSPIRNHDDIPFEGIDNQLDNDESLPPSIDGAPTSARKSTVTGGERQAFEKLYKKFSQEQKMQDEDDQVFDEFYEEEDDTDDEANSLDALFDAVLDQKPTQRRSKNKENLQTLAESILTPEVERARQRRRAAMKQSNAELQTRTKQERSRVVASLRWAKTDREIWDILHREVFEKIRALDLDGKPTSLKRQRNNDGAENPQVLFSNASVLIFQAALLLRQKHAGSPFPFQIIPTLKSLGRSAYALGASTDLYNVLLRIAWAQHTSYTYLENLLTDMENGGIEFNLRTLKTLDGVLQEYRTLCRATSTTANTIFRMDLHAEGAQKVLGWRDLVKERVEREARSGKARTVQGVGVGARGMGAAASGISPRKTMMR